MLEDKSREEQAKKLEQRDAEKKALADEAKRQAATIGAFWETRYWPYRLSLKRSEKETRTINGRWRNHIAPFSGIFP